MKINLTEPLISEDTKNNIQNYVITQDYRNEQERRRKLPDPKNYEDVKKVFEEPQKIQQVKIKTYDELNSRNDLIQTFEEGDNDMDFFRKSSAIHDVPVVNVIKTTYYQKKPNTFACILKSAAQSFKNLELMEMIGIEDYKRLLKLRIRNYVAIIKMLYRIYHKHKNQDDMFKDFRTKLFQVKKLMSSLYMENEFKNLLERVQENIYPFSKVAQPEEEKKAFDLNGGKGDIGNDDFIDQDEEDGNNNIDSDNEYDDYFKCSSIRHYTQNYSRMLMREEEKWVVRAKWLEDTLDLLKCDENLINWFPWFQAKMDQLVDLDVNIKTESVDQSSQVFYIHKFIEEKLKPYNPQTEYENDAKIQIDKQNFYPKVEHNTKDLQNDFRPVLRSWTDVREKLCLKIKKTEADTDYFLTVFDKKILGNEKSYERRINTGGNLIDVTKFNFSPNGKYIQFGFNLQGVAFEIIFSLGSQFKEPLLVKSNNSFSDFANHYFYCVKGNTVYQYDLQDYSKIQKYNIPFTIENSQNFFISRETDQGSFSYVRKIKVDESEEALKKQTNQTHELFIKDQLCLIDQVEKFPDDAIFAINGTQDQLLVQYWSGANPPQLIIAKYVLETKKGSLLKLMGGNQPTSALTTATPQLTFKKETNLIFQVKDLFEIEKGITIRLVPLRKDFVIIFKPSKAGKNNSYIFKNDQYLTDCNPSSVDSLSFAPGPEGISKIFITEDQSSNNAANILRFQVAMLEEIALNKKEWKWRNVNISILNQQYVSCFPYAYFLYNHDQVYMKDLNKPKNEGIYYMNGFLGIQNNTRPLTIFSMAYNGKLVLMVPAINSNYDRKNFLLRTHEIKTKQQQTNRYRFEGYLRYRIFAWNQDMVNVLRSWLPEVEESLSMPSTIDIRITNKHNSIALEKLVDRKCYERFIITSFSPPYSDSRNVTDPNQSLNERQMFFWLFVKQTKSEISVYQRNIRYSFHLEYFQELEAIFVYTVDQQSDDIYDIYIDTLAQNRLDLYLMNSNGQLKRFTTPVEYGKNIEALTDDPLIYSIESYMASVKKDAGQSSADKGAVGATSSKKVDLWDTKVDGFVANRVFYSTQCIVDFTPVRTVDRIQQGYKLPPLYKMPEYLLKLTLSTNEAKVVAVWKYENQLCFVVSPLVNSRQIPLFNQTRFVHPVVPMIDKLNGYSQVFTLSIVNRRVDQYNTSDHMTHSRYRMKGYRFLKMPNPGLLIKYFNGIEQKVPFSDFGEEFEDILRFKQSLNGQFIVIFGTRKGSVFEDKNYLINNDLDQKDQYQGIFIYELKLGSIQLIKSFIFAEKDMDKYTKSVKERLDKLPYEILEKEMEQKQDELKNSSEIKTIEENLTKLKETQDAYKASFKDLLDNEELLSKTVVNSSSFSEARKSDESKKKQKEDFEIKIKGVEEEIKTQEKNLEAKKEEKTKKMAEYDTIIAKLNEEKDRLVVVQTKFNNRKLQKASTPEYVQPEINGRQFNEMSDDFEDYSYYLLCGLGYDQYTSDIDFNAYNKDFVMKKLIEEIKAKEKLVKKEKDAVTIVKTQQMYEEEAKAMQEYKQIPSIENLKINYTGLDLPYIEDPPSDQTEYLEKREKAIYFVRDLPNKKLKEGEAVQEQLSDNYNFDQVERDQIRRIMFNIHLEVSEQGDIFLIERIHNVLYYFYKNKVDNDYRLEKRPFEQEFLISSADSSEDYLVVSSRDRYQVFNIDRNAKKDITPFKYDQLSIEDKDNDKVKQGVFLDSKPPVKISTDNQEKKQAANTYSWTLDNCKIYGNHLMLKINDNQGINYFKVFDVKSKINVLYIEGTKIAVSGCKQYLWLLESNQVYDVNNGLSTFFLWPGDQINTPGYDSYDLFNVFQDRTIMSTLGYLQLSFNYISLTIDQELYKNNFDFLDKKTNTIARTCFFQYMFYKIGNNRSILERIFKEDKDKNQIDYVPPPLIQKLKLPGLLEEQKKALTDEEIQKAQDEISNTWDSQIKQLFNMLNFLTESYNIEQNNPTLITNFFFSYYYIGKTNILDPKKKNVYKEQVSKYYNIFSKLYMGPGEARTDIIDDILHYVVLSDVPILQYVINTCFLKFMKTANTSQAFQEYLKNITKQTSAMKNLDKFQMIKLTDEATVYVESYDSPIIDDGFYSKFRKDKAPKKDVDIYYIYLGEILNKEGEDLMETLTEEKYLPMMDIPFIQYLVMYQWLKVKDNIQKRLLIPFFILLGMFFLYATFQIDWYKDQNATSVQILQELADEITIAQSEGTYNGSLTLDEINSQIASLSESSGALVLIVYILNIMGLTGILGYLFFMEGRQFLAEPTEYFKEFWNVADLVNYFFCTFVLLFDIFDASIEIIRPMAAICVIILWIKLFYFLRVFDTTAKLVRMIFEIVNDMKNFLIVLSIGVIGFANGFYILSQAQKDGIDPFAGSTFIQALIWTYRLSLGDFQLDEFYNLYTVDVIIVWFIFLIASLFVVLVLLNLLIAIMGDTFSRVLENITNLQVREKVMLVAENESLYDRVEIFGNSQYLIVIKEKSLEAQQAENWDGQINMLKRQLMDKLSTMQTTIDDKIADNTTEMKRRFQDFDEKSKKQTTLTENKIASTNKAEMDMVFGKISEMFANLDQKVSMQMGTIQGMQQQMSQLRQANQSLHNIQVSNQSFKRAVYEKLQIENDEDEEDEEEY